VAGRPIEATYPHLPRRHAWKIGRVRVSNVNEAGHFLALHLTGHQPPHPACSIQPLVSSSPLLPSACSYPTCASLHPMTNQICFVVFTLCLLYSHPTLAGPGLDWTGLAFEINQHACVQVHVHVHVHTHVHLPLMSTGNHSVNVNVNLRFVACNSSRLLEVSVNSLFVLVTFVMKLKCMVHVACCMLLCCMCMSCILLCRPFVDLSTFDSGCNQGTQLTACHQM